MSNEDLIRVEKKIDLLYRIILELTVKNRLILDEVLEKVLYELKPLFGLSITDVKELEIPTDEELEKLEKELSDLKQKIKEGNFLAKNKSDLEQKLESLNEDYLNRKRIYNLKDKLTAKFKQYTRELCLKQLYIDLYSKLGISNDNNFYISIIEKDIDALRRGYLDVEEESKSNIF